METCRVDRFVTLDTFRFVFSLRYFPSLKARSHEATTLVGHCTVLFCARKKVVRCNQWLRTPNRERETEESNQNAIENVQKL
jgi:hypothetical protein